MQKTSVIFINKADIKQKGKTFTISKDAEVITIKNMFTMSFDESKHEYLGYPVEHPRWGGMHALEKHKRYVVFIGDGKEFYVIGAENGVIYGNHTFVGKHSGFKVYQEHNKHDQEPPFVVSIKDVKGL